MSLNISIQVVVFVITFVLALIAGSILIPVLTRLKFGQTVREDGPSSHLKKTGTPTMGGLIFLIPMVLVSAFFSSAYPQLLPMVLTTAGFGFVGFLDDFIIIIKKKNKGLSPNQKMLGLFIVASLFTLYVTYFSGVGTDMVIPFMGTDFTINLPVWFFIPFTILILLTATNAVNLTDGLDGLASGVVLIIMVFFTIVAMTRNEWDYLKVFSAITAGGCLGFLAFNIHPAKVFMGNLGALALGGAVGVTAVMMKIPWIFFIAGAICIIEVLSVILQVASFKIRGKRIFKMAPIHHHFELSGWKETRVVGTFWLITAVCCIIGFITLRLKVF
jgi:phospho-N-acetylmuramoyl-pentapeptide-transferase